MFKKTMLSTIMISLFSASAMAASLEKNNFSATYLDDKAKSELLSKLPPIFKNIKIADVVETNASEEYYWIITSPEQNVLEPLALLKANLSMVAPDLINTSNPNDSIKQMVKDSYAEKIAPVTLKELNDLPYIAGGTKGKEIMHVFTDPQCPFCKKLESYITKNKLNERYEIRYHLTPLPSHKMAIPISDAILSMKKDEQEKALLAFMSEQPTEETMKYLDSIFSKFNMSSVEKEKDEKKKAELKEKIEKAQKEANAAGKAHYGKSLEFVMSHYLDGVPRIYTGQEGNLKYAVGVDPDALDKMFGISK
jgi:protein-disulfide isomerase